jgi:hypothetical protein
VGAPRFAWCAAVFVACASAGDPSAPDVPVDAQVVKPGDAPPPPIARECPGGELAVDISSTGQVTCAPLDEAAVRAAIEASCSVYLGWRDNCDGCLSPPSKWGRAGATCDVGVGTNNRCTTQTLGGVTLPMFGLDLDGNVDGNDKLYAGLHCTSSSPSRQELAPCPAGHLVTGKNGTAWTCAPIAQAVTEYVRTSCSLYLGWQDNCRGCTLPPVKWGWAGPAGCQNGAGLDNTCTLASLGNEPVQLFGLSFDGDVDDNDKIHVGLRCTLPSPATAMSTGACPAGQFVTATREDGSFVCASLAPHAASYFTERCSLYFGWRDNCNGCTSPPAKWGHTRVGSCTLGAGLYDTCSDFTLGGATISMFGLAPDGDVDGNDMLYVGLRCL